MDRWRDSPELTAVLARARALLERNGLRIAGEVTLRQDGDLPELYRLRRAMGGSRANSATPKVTFPLPVIDAYLSGPGYGNAGLLDWLAAQSPLIDKPARRASADAAERDALALVAAALADHPTRLAALTGQRGFAATLADGSALAAARILAALPARLTLPELAERCTGDTKALSRAPVRDRVLRVLAAELGVAAPRTAAEQAGLWTQFGVDAGAANSRLTMYGVRVTGDDVLDALLRRGNEDGVPFVMTLQQIDAWDVRLAPGDVYVCENPSVVSAAARTLGPRCPALVCTEGLPAIAVFRLLESVQGTIRWRGDFDWTGLRTTARAIADLDATPWLMDSATYRAGLGLDRVSEAFKSDDRPAPSPWEPDLTEAMLAADRAVMEERLIPILLDSLAAGV